MRDYSEGPGHSLEIRKVLTAGAFDINPTDYPP